ncbi:hypothetical protein OZX72_09190 [Bifidobacterium sp. ESL0769]|uniref:hypothetical protein n=1 Tax=Bifidobacterium sp. ESL0769 TaxID=2983229 RepID=UPI0023F7A266|nr:hypothetical protein [Bifidobacterium sp. ESL0769]WEV67389.1 hypothetical protein OZX72_09190 [Bifidobacterium sp. ESL0769]
MRRIPTEKRLALPEYEYAIAAEAEQARKGEIPTYNLNETLDRLGLEREDVDA